MNSAQVVAGKSNLEVKSDKVTEKTADNVYCVISTGSRVTLEKNFRLVLAYALSLGRQQDVARAVSKSQGQVSRWSSGAKVPRSCNLPGIIRRLSAFVDRRSRKSKGSE